MEVGREERRQAEWDNARWRISMEINPESKVGELYAMDRESGEDSFQRVDLKGEKGWKTLCDSLERLGGKKHKPNHKASSPNPPRLRPEWTCLLCRISPHAKRRSAIVRIQWR